VANFSVATIFSAVDHLSETFDKWNKKGEKFEGDQKKHFEGASEAASRFKAVFEGSLAAKGVEKLIDVAKELPKQFEEFAEKGEKIGRMATTIGMAADEYQRLQYAAKMMDIDSGSLDNALKKLNLGLGQLTTNTGPLSKGLRGVDSQLLIQLRTSKSAGQAFLLVAEAVKKTDNVQKRAAIVTAAFGKQGQALIPMLLKGKEGLAEYMKEADLYGSVLDEKAIAASERFSDSMKKTRGMLENVKNQVLGGLLEKLQPIIDKFVDWVAANKDLISQRIGEIIEGIGKFAQRAYAFIKDWGPAILAAVAAFYLLRGATIAFSAITAIMKVAQVAMFAYSAFTQGAATAQEALNLVMDANPIGLIIVGIAALIAIVVLMIQHWNDATGVFVIVKKSIMSLITLAFLPLLVTIELITRGIEIFGKLFGINTDKVAAFRKGMEGFVVRNTFLSGTDNSKDAKSAGEKAPNASALAAGQSSYQGRLEIAGAPQGSKLTGSYRGPAQIRPELAGAAGGNNF
jgi:hypothetical protein